MTLDVKSIPPTAALLDVDGIPVVFDWDNEICVAWDSDPPRDFPAGPAIHNGVNLDLAEFEALIAKS